MTSSSSQSAASAAEATPGSATALTPGAPAVEGVKRQAGRTFDRTIVATAAALNLTLLTADPAIRAARACAVEYYPFKPSRGSGR